VLGIGVLAVAAVRAHSVALAGFGLDSLIEIGASTVVLWELSDTGEQRQRRALRLIAAAFLALAAYLTVQTILVFATGYHPGHSVIGIVWTALTAAAMFALATGKTRTGRQLANPVLTAEGRVTVIDGLLAVAVLAGLVLNATLGWWWADPLAGLVIVYYGIKKLYTSTSVCARPPADVVAGRTQPRRRRLCVVPGSAGAAVACAPPRPPSTAQLRDACACSRIWCGCCAVWPLTAACPAVSVSGCCS